MPELSASEFRRNLASALDEVVETGTPLIVTRRGGRGDVVVIPAEEFGRWQETAHLLRSPANARRLLRAAEAARAGQTRERTLLPSPPSSRRTRRV